jgi:hypothetical protein
MHYESGAGAGFMRAIAQQFTALDGATESLNSTASPPSTGGRRLATTHPAMPWQGEPCKTDGER